MSSLGIFILFIALLALIFILAVWVLLMEDDIDCQTLHCTNTTNTYQLHAKQAQIDNATAHAQALTVNVRQCKADMLKLAERTFGLKRQVLTKTQHLISLQQECQRQQAATQRIVAIMTRYAKLPSHQVVTPAQIQADLSHLPKIN